MISIARGGGHCIVHVNHHRGLTLVLTLVISSLLGQALLAGGTTVFPNYRFYSGTPNEIHAFSKQVRLDVNATWTKLKAKYPDEPEKAGRKPAMLALNVVKKRLEALEKDLRRGVPPKHSPVSVLRDSGKGVAPSTLKREFQMIQRLHYSAMADLAEQPRPPMILLLAEVAGSIMFSPIFLSIPDAKIITQPLGSINSRCEASDLWTTDHSKSVSLEELTRLSPLQISRLEPRKEHPAWRTSTKPRKYDDFLKDILTRIRACDKKLKSFDFSYAKRIMVFDKFSDDATSPKLRAKDRYGLEWKVKWGDEVHADVAATRLAIAVGSPYVDQKFWSGPGETIVILLQDPKKGPTDFPALNKMMRESRLKCGIKRYLIDQPSLKDQSGRILGTGRVDNAMIERESLKSKHLGCIYLAFKECQLSLYNPAIKRLGGIDLGDKGTAVDDRVARGSIIFHTWIQNPDTKEDNHRGGLLFNTKTHKYDEYVEFPSDLGTAFWGLAAGGNLSYLSPSCIGRAFHRTIPKMGTFYPPRVWRHCTWADARWMAGKIARMSRSDLEEAFLDSGWPSFAQRLGVEKLLARRNELVKAFLLEKDGYKIIPCQPMLTLSVNTAKGKDTVVKNGKILRNSPSVKKLVETVHPEGLANVRSRFMD